MATILLIDGDPVWRSFCERELRREGFRVRTARNGTEGLEATLADPPDLVILEVRLAGIDGLDLMARILDRHPAMPVILNTTCAAFRDNFLSWSADAYLIKSVDTSDLLEKVREALERHSNVVPFRRPELPPHPVGA